MRVILRGLNKRLIAVEKHSIVFLEEAEINGDLVTNIHFTNTRWVTCGLSLNEVETLLEKPEEMQEAEREARVQQWREQAKAKRLFDEEIDEIKRRVAAEFKGMKNTRAETKINADGSKTYSLTYYPEGRDEKA